LLGRARFIAQPFPALITTNSLACEQAHLVCYLREYLGGGSRAGEKNGASKSEPARKPLNFEFSAFVHERSILIGLK